MKKLPITPILKKSAVKIAIVIVLVIAIGWLAYWASLVVAFNGSSFAPNKAQEIARPIGESLEGAGVVKTIENGAKGTEPTSDGPWYEVTYRSDLNTDRLVEIAKEAAADSGYNLRLDDANNENTISYVDDSKTSPFSDLKNGKIVLWLEIHKNTSSAANDKQSGTDKKYTTIDLGVTLPNRKDR